ncbi:GFA family protein [Paracoccus aerodenitrificans]|uniref:GFA family protein n=1 Tax=Paracoccus aerodenitrificans TaxID=3017781 RepID=UPI0022F11142|nr:GFA family protein [Paracoccus aerodenitrificans]WBU62981.1 GFA family protein [Paracoccus aerodenitrificans]
MAVHHYTGSCQCGAVTFEVDTDLDQVNICNCSRCQRIGAVWSFVPAESVRMVRDGPTTEFLFNKNAISHRFCPTCGVEAYAVGENNGQKMIGINVNCLEGVDPRSLSAKMVDGASF